MQAGETNFTDLIEGNRQYEIPLWQRRYAWKSEQWNALWVQALRQYTTLARTPEGEAPTNPTHFLGSFVLSPRVGFAADLPRFRVVDGQR